MQINALKEVNLHIDEARIVIKHREISLEEQHFNILHYGVRYPSAISEAIISIKTQHDTRSIILKVDSGASVSLAHSDYLTDIGNCINRGMPPVRLSGIGGRTAIMTKVGTLTIKASTGEVVKIKCYVFDTPVGRTTHLCLISTWAIDRHQVDQNYHTHIPSHRTAKLTLPQDKAQQSPATPKQKETPSRARVSPAM